MSAETRRPSRKTCYDHMNLIFSIICSIIVGIVVIFVCAGFIYFFVLVFSFISYPKFQVDSIVVSPFNVSGASPLTNANWDIGLSIRNPNVKQSKFKYNQLDVSISYKTEYFTGIKLKPLRQHGKNTTLLKTSIYVAEKPFGDLVSISMAEDMKLGFANFDVNLQGVVDFTQKLVPSRPTFWMRASCPNIRIGFSSNNTAAMMLDGPRRCEVLLTRDDNNYR